MQKITMPLLLAAVLFLSACSLSKISAGADSTPASCPLDLEAEADRLAQAQLRDKRFSGLVIGVQLADGSEHFFGYGRTSETNPEVPGADTVAAIGSLTKGLVGALTQSLIEDGTIHWDDRLVFPESVHPSESARQITLRELATHSSGLPRQPQTFEFF
ncbi:MAG: serine hydrolase, partial [Pseudomonadales bacterium]|nr:serine hydrolase [Pseudomonadales bacterium]